jgi:cytochrome P450
MSSATSPDVPSQAPAELTRNFDYLYDPAVLADPWAAMDRLRDDAPVMWSPELGGYWIVSGADEVREVSRNWEVFSSNPVTIPPAQKWPRPLNPEELDGDEHDRYRRLLTPLFSPRAIRPLAESVRDRATRLITAFAGDPGCEFVDQLARPLPSSVFLGIFGAPVEQADVFTAWVRDLLHSTDENVNAAAGQTIVGYLMETIAKRQAEPAGDMISALTQMEVDGRRLTAEELLDMTFLLFIAGMDTITNQLGAITLQLATHPEQQQALRDNPGLIDDALEELLRLNPIVTPGRRVTRDYVMNGIEFKKGQMVMIANMGAARDPKAFPDPLEVKFDRDVSWTTAFGLGPHRCLGMHLARQELRIVLELMATLAPPYRLAPGATWNWITAGGVWGLDRLDLEFIRD